VRRDVLEPDRAQVGERADAALDFLDRGQAAAGEDQPVDEAGRRLFDLVGAVVDRDCLQQHHAVVGQQVAAGAEERWKVAPADRLDHLDRDELVVAAAQQAVVLEQHGDTVLETRVAHALHGDGVLLPGDRGRGHAAA